MYAYIKGSLEVKTRGYIVVETNGVGYKIFMSETAIDKLGDIGEVVKIHTYMKVREDDISLYGFNTNEELRMFELLISVSGIGAKSAITILSNISPSSFIYCIVADDVDKLKKLPGIGAKTAQRMILELKDKIKAESTIGEESVTEIKKEIKNNDNILEATSALQVLGYSRKEIESAFEKIESNELSVEELIKKALVQLSK